MDLGHAARGKAAILSAVEASADHLDVGSRAAALRDGATSLVFFVLGAVTGLAVMNSEKVVHAARDWVHLWVGHVREAVASAVERSRSRRAAEERVAGKAATHENGVAAAVGGVVTRNDGGGVRRHSVLSKSSASTCTDHDDDSDNSECECSCGESCDCDSCYSEDDDVDDEDSHTSAPSPNSASPTSRIPHHITTAPTPTSATATSSSRVRSRSPSPLHRLLAPDEPLPLQQLHMDDMPLSQRSSISPRSPDTDSSVEPYTRWSDAFEGGHGSVQVQMQAQTQANANSEHAPRSTSTHATDFPDSPSHPSAPDSSSHSSAPAPDADAADSDSPDITLSHVTSTTPQSLSSTLSDSPLDRVLSHNSASSSSSPRDGDAVLHHLDAREEGDSTREEAEEEHQAEERDEDEEEEDEPTLAVEEDTGVLGGGGDFVIPPTDADAGADADDPTSPLSEAPTLLRLCYAVAEDASRRRGLVHRGTRCDGCGVTPIVGVRYKCINCPNFDLCEECEERVEAGDGVVEPGSGGGAGGAGWEEQKQEQGEGGARGGVGVAITAGAGAGADGDDDLPPAIHPRTHVFAKLKVAIPPLANRTGAPAVARAFYPGRPFYHSRVAKEVVERVGKETQFDPAELSSFYTQHLSLSTDPRGISRATFAQCLGPLGAMPRNLIADRVFRFFDRDGDGFIGFEEMARGLGVMCKGGLDERVKYAFHSHQLTPHPATGEPTLLPADLRRTLTAYFLLSTELVRDVVKTMEEGMMEGFDEDASKPVSAAFTAGVPAGSAGPEEDDQEGKTFVHEDEDQVGGLPPPVETRPGTPATPASIGGSAWGDVGDPGWSDEDELDRESRAGRRRDKGKGKARDVDVTNGSTSGSASATGLPPARAPTAADLPPRAAPTRHNRSLRISPGGPAPIPASASAGWTPSSASSVRYSPHLSASRHPVVHTLAQDAIREMVERTFRRAGCADGEGMTEKQFAKAVEEDGNLLAWFEALGSVF
ncbi:hypothetical protein M427DRAFT_51410 [Gonapodya prolifera JEL478]|uniref:EF-hand n=1 Tax=Gonapodya prolifera (strain JEL478) TaxID=1344416 RepID=A0A139AWR3_GONPJ|nr:hypothetical protein M427DRAFT_51410 [Gonapodya prolifera JEL478]|eukprot:KXS21139.1 hypothetical protein M427DRAFT_51410 [Gonapodya prolifera JEL478]